MSAPINDGGPAFPFGQVSEVTGQPINGFFFPGMTLRDYFAGQALAGILAKETLWDAAADSLAHRVYNVADAMLKAREAQP